MNISLVLLFSSAVLLVVLIVIVWEHRSRTPGAVVSDTSVIIYLAAIGQIDILRQLYGTVYIPPQVLHELTQDEDQPGSYEARHLRWIQQRTVRQNALIETLLASHPRLHRGEVEAIVLAQELQVLLLIDEATGRRLAGHLGLKYIGLLGVLIQAKKDGLIPAVKPLMDQTIQKGFFVSKPVYQQVLIEANEAE